MTIKELVKDTTARFSFYRAGNLYYEIVGKGFEFPVPISDVGDASFNVEEKGLLMMRYIRKHLQTIERCGS